MARKRSPAPDPPAPPEPSAEAAPSSKPVPDIPMVADMPVGALLQMLGRSLPPNSPPSAQLTPVSPDGIDAEARLSDLTVRELLQLLESF